MIKARRAEKVRRFFVKNPLAIREKSCYTERKNEWGFEMISVALAVLETEEQRNLLAEFYEQNKNRLYLIAFSKLHNSQSAEDAVVETLLRIADKPERFFRLSGKEQTAFANVVVRNVSVDMYNKSRKSETVELSEEILYNNADNPSEEQLLFKFTRETLRELIKNLPPLQRDILYMKAVRKLEISEIAQTLSVSENVVRQRLFQARQTLKKQLEKEVNLS